jgi:hypothetical protein
VGEFISKLEGAMSRIIVLLTVALFTVACSDSKGPERQGEVRLTDGTVLEGKITAASGGGVTVVTADGVSHPVTAAQVRSVEYDDAPPPVASGSSPQQGSSQPGSPQQGPAAAAAAPVRHETHTHPAPEAIKTRTFRLEAGAELPVRTEETIDSSEAVEGQVYAAEIVKDINDADGAVVIPKGSNAQIVIRSASKGGRFKGASDLLLDLQSVSVGGKKYLVDTAEVQKKGRDGVGANKRTAIYTGTGAAVGAIIGAIAGGGRGAAIGAGSGAGAGVLTQILTKGSAIKVPAETTLTFKLDSALKIQAAR